MPPTNDDPEALASVTTEQEALLIAEALKEEGIDATVQGALTAGFRAEAPGYVQVIVPQHELERARQVLDAWRQGRHKTDWSNVDVGEEE